MKRWSTPIIAALLTVILTRTKDDGPLAVERTLILMVAPDEWGKNLPQAAGKVIFTEPSTSGLEGRIEAEGLEANVSYVLSINGKPSHPSNARLPQKKDDSEERYLDYATIQADAGGVLAGKFLAPLEPGSYDVKIFLKDSHDWKIVLYNDYLKFNVK